ncbi:MAG: ShlB/FhaC/HecB family hemolysin secretion/activation protein [Alphaproteobacteria bacterium]|nr:ShlB/FhaC/HecB family hemolysin secretion/activation protein [Alphaproteobacteria bacterium]
MSQRTSLSDGPALGCLRTLATLVVFVATYALAVFGLSSAVLAQAPPPVLQAPPQLTPPTRPPEPGTIPAPSGPAAPTAPPGAQSVTLTPVDIQVEGNTIYTHGELDALVRPLIGRQVPASEIFKLAEAIQRKYRDDGYFLATVTVPQQRVADGRLRLMVTEGYISNVLIEGDVGPVSEKAKEYLDNLVGKKPINISDLERYLLLTEDLPGVKVKAVMRPGREPGSSELIAQLQREWWDLFNQTDNRGSNFTGPVQSLFAGGINSFTSMGDRLELSYFTTLDTENNFLQGAYSGYIGSEGFRFRLYGGYGRIRPGDPISQTGYFGQVTIAGLQLYHPIIRSRRVNVALNGSFDYYRSIVDVTGNIRLSAVDLRSVRGWIDASYRDPFNGVTYGNIRFSKGVNVLGASKAGDQLLPRQGADPNYFKVNAEVSRLQGLYSDDDFALNLFVTGAAQISDNILPPSEKFFLGGERLGRGYYAGQVTGDRAIAASIELQLSFAVPYSDVQPSSAPSSVAGRVRGLPLQLYAFYDYGKAWNLATFETPTIVARSYGFGVRANVGDTLTVEAEAVRRIDLAVDGAAAPRLNPWGAYFRATTRF